MLKMKQVDTDQTALFSLDRLYRAATAHLFFVETGHLLNSGGRTPNSVEIYNLRNELTAALVDIRLNYYTSEDEG